jgi:hypothetical protein
MGDRFINQIVNREKELRAYFTRAEVPRNFASEPTTTTHSHGLRDDEWPGNRLKTQTQKHWVPSPKSEVERSIEREDYEYSKYIDEEHPDSIPPIRINITVGDEDEGDYFAHGVV